MENIKTFGEFINESVVNGFDYEAAKQDLKAVDDAYTKAEKRLIADKYGIESNKISEIKKAIYLIGNEVHKSKKPEEYTDEDFLWWWRCFDAPTTSVTLKKALEGESVPWFEFILKKAEELIFNGRRSDYWTRAKNSFDKYVVGLINKDKNANDRRYTNLLSILFSETKDFHDRYIEQVRVWADKRFDTFKQFKDFDIYDFMSFFGTLDRDRVAAIYESKEHPRDGVSEVYRRIKKVGYSFSPISTEYIPKKKTVEFNDLIEAKPVRKREDWLYAWRNNEDLRNRELYADLPSELALHTQTETQVLANHYQWNKRKYVDEVVKNAENKYKHDMEHIAEKIRRMNMDENNLKVETIYPDVIHYDITLTDGFKSVHARSIFAAEFSVKVTPHYRFIIT